MPILGGNQIHDGVEQQLTEDSPVKNSYIKGNDIASQLLKEEAYRTSCMLDEKEQNKGFLAKFKAFFFS